MSSSGTHSWVDFLHHSSTRAQYMLPKVSRHLNGSNFKTCKNNAFDSMCLVLRIESLRWMMMMAAVEWQQSICDGNGFGSTVSRHRNCRSQRHNCLSTIPSQAPNDPVTVSASPLLSAIVDCFLLVAVMGYQLWFPRIHDAVPLTLRLSESPVQWESLNVKTEPSHAPFAVVKPNCNGSIVITPGLALQHIKIDLMFSCLFHLLGQGSTSLSHRRSAVDQLQFANQRSIHAMFKIAAVLLRRSPAHSNRTLERCHVV